LISVILFQVFRLTNTPFNTTVNNLPIVSTPVSAPIVSYISYPQTETLTYINDYYKYSIEYPSNYYIEPYNYNNSLILGEIGPNETGGIFSAKINGNESLSTTSFSGMPLKESWNGIEFKEVLMTKGKDFGDCYENVPDSIEDFTTNSGIKGYKVYYWVIAGCRGSTSRYLLKEAHYFFGPFNNNSWFMSIFSSNDETAKSFKLL
jgi:hypothetical protein